MKTSPVTDWLHAKFGFFSGVGVEYSGAITPTTAGGAGHTDFALAYPAMLGAPATFPQIYMPLKSH